MKRKIHKGQVVATLLVSTTAASVAWTQIQSNKVTTPPMTMSSRADEKMVSNIIDKWMDEPKKAAETMIKKYGQPNEASATHLTWWGNGPWKWTKVENVEIPHKFPAPHHDLLQQAIDWKIEPKWFTAIAEYDGSVIVERTRGEVSARCDKEEANFLALNLTHDIVSGKRSAENARAFYAETIKQLMANKLDAQHKPYLSGLMFERKMEMTNDPDVPHGGG